MEQVVAGKEQANALFKAGDYMKAAARYGSAVEVMVQEEAANPAVCANDKWADMKATLFLNLAAANLKLEAYEGCKRCCNTTLLFCNNPYLPLEEMGIEDDLTGNAMTATEPVLPSHQTIVGKALFRRGQSNLSLGDAEQAMLDFQTALRCIPNDKAVTSALTSLRNHFVPTTAQGNSEREHQKQREPIAYHNTTHNKPTNSASSNSSNRTQTVDIPEADLLSMTGNGGLCLLGKGFWSQTPHEARVYLSLSEILPLNYLADNETVNAKDVKLEFFKMSVQLFLKSELYQELQLEYAITPAQCIWAVESCVSCYDRGGVPTSASKQGYPTKASSSEAKSTHLVLYLQKAASLEWFPGCEWWDRVFIYDDPIDTLLCSVGSDVSQLPQKAIERAEKENHRFSQLGVAEQNQELEQLAKKKTDFTKQLSADMLKAHNKRETKVRAEGAKGAKNDGAESVHRGQTDEQTMGWLRRQFPNIKFDVKDEESPLGTS
jgi:tetratricopeptide (TPR) repeat protein